MGVRISLPVLQKIKDADEEIYFRIDSRTERQSYVAFMGSTSV
tara:strand:- start:2151 stop:2279 length:129 start_codon:yes stop_codon:yes gene_type:complete